jgi:hypothetical protein
MFSDLLRADRERARFTAEQAARRLRVPPVAYRKLEAGTTIAEHREVGPDLQVARLAADVRVMHWAIRSIH